MCYSFAACSIAQYAFTVSSPLFGRRVAVGKHRKLCRRMSRMAWSSQYCSDLPFKYCLSYDSRIHWRRQAYPLRLEFTLVFAIILSDSYCVILGQKYVRGTV
jgi:hypothetical protein